MSLLSYQKNPTPASQAVTKIAREKVAYGDRPDNMEIAPYAPMGGLIGGYLLAELINNHYGKNIMRALDKTPKAKKQQLKKILQHANLQHMPAIRYPNLQNAFYADPEYWGDPVNMEYAMPPIHEHFRKHKGALDKARQYGLVAYDPNFGTQGILAHEAGHAAIRNQPSGSLSRFNQSYLRPITGMLNAFSPFVGVGAGLLSGNPLVGAAVGGGMSALTGAPTLINEAQATRHAYRYADKNIRDEKEKELTRKALNNAYGTYGSAMLVPGLAAGGLAGAIAYNSDSWKHLGNFGNEVAGELKDFGHGIAKHLGM